MTAPTAILFDADGVIQRAPLDIRRRLTAALGGSPDQTEVCMADIFAAEAPALTGGCDFAEGLAAVLAKWNARCDAAGFLAEWLTMEVDASVMGLVAELRRSGVHCALASNQEARRARYMSEILGYGEAFDREYYSCGVGHTKPTTDYFSEVVRLGALDPARTLFIDDRPENVDAARRSGLLAAHFVLGEMGDGARHLRPLLAGHGIRLAP